MRSPEEVVAKIEGRLTSTWAAAVTHDTDAATLDAESSIGPGDAAVGWPYAFPLGEETSAELAGGFDAVVHQLVRWRTWAAGHDVRLRGRSRRVLGTPQEIPTHLEVDTVDVAAAIVGGDWPDRLARGRVRAASLADRFPHLRRPERVVAAVDGFTDLDFDLLCRAGVWFATHDAPGLTPRQVPIEGLHAKWLNTRQRLVATLAGVDDLNLAPPHPARIHFTYLDPTYRASDGRLHDSASVGDRVSLPYRPRVVVISENKDTAVGFLPVAGGVAVEGVGRGGQTAAAFTWIRDAPVVFYWGDMDADGLEILNEFRDAGVPARSLLMNPAAYAQWERFGVNVDVHGKPLKPRMPRPVPHLTDPERDLYEQMCSPEWVRFRRVEQERIPLSVALEVVERHTSQ